MTGPPCELCALAQEPAGQLDLFEADGWRVFVHPEYARANCVWVVATDHAEGLWDLGDRQARSFGTVTRQVAAALRATGSVKVYIVSFGENLPHFHALVIGRADGDEKGLDLTARHLTKTAPDPGAAAKLAEGLRTA